VFLIDTNIVSAVAPARRRSQGDERVAAWIEASSARLFLSAITAAEIEDGIAKAERTGATRKAGMLRQWWDAVRHLYGDRILPFELSMTATAGGLTDRARALGLDPGFEDIAIAATAQTRGLTVVTANARHFRPLGVSVLEPHELTA
jgi:predicted nucleic acid-binding protein